MPVFGRSFPVDIVHAPGTPEEKRWSTSMGGNLVTTALFYAPDRVVTGDEIHAPSLFDEPRVISSVHPATSAGGTLTHWEAQMLPLSHWQRENSHLPPRKTSQVLIFISHAHEDREVAKCFTDLLRIALRLPTTSIRCTSVEGHRLRGGADTAQQLKREINEARAFIGIVSPRSIKSLYVLFELGARWGADKHLVPLLAPGAGPEQLVGPMAGINALRADSAADLHQLLRELASELGLTLEAADGYERQLKDVTLTPVPPTANANGTVSAVDLIEGLAESAADLLLAAVNDRGGGDVPIAVEN